MEEKKTNPIAQILGFANQEKGRMIASCILSTLSVVCGVIPYITVGKLLAQLLMGGTDSNEISKMALISAVAFLASEVFNGISVFVSHKAAYGILYNIRMALVEKIERTSMGEIQNKQSGSFKQTVIDLVEQLEYALAHAIPEVVSNTLLPIAVVVYLFIVDWRIALAALVSVIVGFVVWGMMMGGGAMEIFSHTQEGNEKMNNTIVEYVNGMEVIKTFNQTASSSEKYSNVVIYYRDVLVRWFRHCWPYLSIYSVVTPTTIAFVLPVSGLLYYNGKIGIDTLVSCMILAFGIVASLMKLVNFTDHFNEIFIANTKIQGILETDEIEWGEKKKKLKDSSIEFKNVTFGYEETTVLDNVSFMAKSKSTVALVGASGSGKSTMAKLIARFWDANTGTIKIGGVDIREFPYEQLMDTISYVSQDNFLPDMTLLENIRMGKPGASDTEVREVAKKAGCDEFINNFPAGYNTNVGDAGGKLSGGERQRIAIARAMIKDSPIVLLDEATASIDPENEVKIQQALNKLTKNKTVVVIAHRLSTIVDSDQIILVDKGTVKAHGTHQELLMKSQQYKTMWENHTRAKGWSLGKEDLVCGE